MPPGGGGTGGGAAINVDLTLFPYKTSSSFLPSSSSSSSSSTSLPVSVNNNSGVPIRQSCSTAATDSCSRTGLAHRDEIRRGRPIFDTVIERPPSRFEVETAFAALQEALVLYASGRVSDMFRALLREPSVQRLVVSLSSDKAVWNAIVNNEMVRRLTTGENYRIQSCDEETDMTASILKWVMSIIKAKVAELIRNFQALMEDVCESPVRQNQGAETQNEMNHNVKSSLLLSIVIVLIVVVARCHQC
ncbi:hypothetical protein K2173_024832 [Erythroxylum novogranatense]|uniref:Uncharacterized protein n=1 Tax=Erythroxylum novogranatense TaxID=1862640 RepID=A0AAV8UFV6_9ROSI|nr:hypothetical protein K2173_024832 [Erythroxylum novogranatense]